MFEAVGIEYQTQLQDPKDFFGETFNSGAWDVGMWSWAGSSGFDGLVTIHDAFDPEGSLPEGSNYYRWGTEDSSVRNQYTKRFAEVRDLMNSTVDDVELESLVAEAEEILASRMVILPLFAYPVFGAVWEDEIAGFVQTPTQADYTWNVEQWYRADL
jgi:ABC-type transport system substrate-binding protein